MKVILNYFKKYSSIIISLMAMLIALFSFFATYKNTQLVEEQNRKIYFDNLLDKINELTIIEDNSNNNFNLYRKDLKLLHNYQLNIIK